MNLINNSKPAEYECAWCGARARRGVHSAACPAGERYKQVQQLGGVPWPVSKPAKTVKGVSGVESRHADEPKVAAVRKNRVRPKGRQTTGRLSVQASRSNARPHSLNRSAEKLESQHG